jgi:DNA-directed RNA polymerase specialized sigma24 family protein
VDTQADSELQHLLLRMRSGDREAAAEFLDRSGPKIRRRIRGKLAPSMRRLFDSQEILSTLGRRLDQFVAGGQLHAATLGELWTLVMRIADHSLIEKARMFRALEAREGEDGPLAHRMLSRLRELERRNAEAPMIEIDAALRSLGPGIDREITSMWLQGSSHAEIAQCVGLAPTAVRKRWESIRHRLRDLFESGGC